MAESSTGRTGAAAAAPSTPDLTLKFVFAALSGITIAATLRTLLLPPWPETPPLPAREPLQQALSRAGLPIASVRSEPGVRQHGRVLGEGLAFTLATGERLRLQPGAARRWEDLQLAFLTRGQADLALQRRQLGRDGQGRPLARGSLRQAQALQTCLVPGTPVADPFGVTHDQLTALLASRVQPLGQRLRGLLGLQPIRRYDCVLISLETPAGRAPSAGVWPTSLAALAPLFAAAPPASDRP